MRAGNCRAVTTVALCSMALFLLRIGSAQQPRPEAGEKAAATVRVGDQTLFAIRSPLGPFSPQDRASAASQKLAALVQDIHLSTKAIRTDEHDVSTDIIGGAVIITTVTESDAAAAGTPRIALASDYARQIRDAVSTVRKQYTYKSLLFGSLYALISTLVLISLLIAFSHLFPRLYSAIESRRGTSIRTLRIQSLELLSAARITELLIQAVRLGRVGTTIVVFYFYIPLVFSFFPWTRTFGATLLDYVLSPIAAGWNAFLTYIPSMLILLIVACFAYLAIRIARFLFTEIERETIRWPGFFPEWAMPTCKIAQLLIIAFALVVMFPYVPGSDSPAFKGVSIFLGVLFSLGSSSAVANVIAGVILTYTRAFRIGDRVQIADTVGDVVAKTLLATHIKTIKNVSITIPNSLVLGSHIINFSASAQGEGLILHTNVTIGYDVPWRQVHSLLIAASVATPGILQNPKPFVFQTSLDDSYVAYEINAYTDQPADMALIYSNLHQNIQDTFNEAGVEIMSPHYHAVRDGNVTAVPESYLPDDYTAGAFRLLPIGRHGKAMSRQKSGRVQGQ